MQRNIVQSLSVFSISHVIADPSLVYAMKRVEMNDEQVQNGADQFARMVGEDKIDDLRARFAELSPDFERAVMGVVGGEIWSRPNLDLRTRSLASIGILALRGIGID